MPCIKKPRLNVKNAWEAYCGKHLGGGFGAFKSIEDAYSDDRPICPNCRKVLNLEKKVIKTKITSSVLSSSELKLTLHFNNKDKMHLNISFDLNNGYTLTDKQPLSEDDAIYVTRELRRSTIDYAKHSIPSLKFDKGDIDLISQLISDQESNYSQEQIERLSEMKDKLSVFVLRNR
jgi:hypothetical protein